jgi:hypothetical protein
MMTMTACSSIAPCIGWLAVGRRSGKRDSTLSDPENDIAPAMDEAERAAEDAAQQAAVQAAAEEAAREADVLTALDSAQAGVFDPPAVP